MHTSYDLELMTLATKRGICGVTTKFIPVTKRCAEAQDDIFLSIPSLLATYHKLSIAVLSTALEIWRANEWIAAKVTSQIPNTNVTFSPLFTIYECTLDHEPSPHAPYSLTNWSHSEFW